MAGLHHDQNDIKVHNMSLVLEIIRRYRPISRAAIAKRLKMSPPSVTRIVMLLQKMGLVAETDVIGGGVGRRPVLLNLETKCVYTAGVQIDSKFLKVCIADFNHDIVACDEQQFHDFAYTPAEVAVLARGLFDALLKKTGLARSVVAGVGVSIVGTVDAACGVATLSPQAKWENVPLAEIFRQAFGLPAFVENDVKSALIGEKHYVDIDETANIAVLHLGSGMGSAATCNGNVIRGKQNAAGEIGHIIIDPSNRIRCDCGRVGCLQTYVAEDFIVKRSRQFAPQFEGFADLKAACQNGEMWALDIVDDIGNGIQTALSILINMYNPAVIVTCGSFFDHFGELIRDMESRLNKMAFKPLGSSCSIVLSESRGFGSVLGAAIIACGEIMVDRFRKVSLLDGD